MLARTRLITSLASTRSAFGLARQAGRGSFVRLPAMRPAIAARSFCAPSCPIVNTDDYVAVPRIGRPAPDFTAKALVDGVFQDVTLSSYQGKYVVLFFYPLDFTFVCPTEIIAFSEKASEFHAIGCEVLACSVDSLYTHLAWTKTSKSEGGLGQVKIPLIADVNREISKKYGVLFGKTGFSLRGLFIIGRKGELRQVTMNEPPVGRSVDEALRLVQAFQHVDEHGEVCPINWRPGSDAMKADPVQSKEYFKKHGEEAAKK